MKTIHSTLALAVAALLAACTSTQDAPRATPEKTGTAAAQEQKQAAPLVIEAFTPDDNAVFKVASVMVQGDKDMILIDAQFSAADAQQVATRIRETGKRLDTIYISHWDPDYYFGLDTIKTAFPDAKIVATPQTIAHIRASKDAKLKTWKPELGANAPRSIPMPEPLQGDTLMLEGQPLKIVGLDGPTPDRTFVWIPSVKTVAGGIPVFGNEHVWMADTQTPESHANWLKTLARIEALNPMVVIPGHFADNSPLDLRSVRFTANYIRAFDEETAKARNATALIEAMKKRYPNLAGESSLELSAKVAKGEMQWP